MDRRFPIPLAGLALSACNVPNSGEWSLVSRDSDGEDIPLHIEDAWGDYSYSITTAAELLLRTDMIGFLSMRYEVQYAGGYYGEGSYVEEETIIVAGRRSGRRTFDLVVDGDLFRCTREDGLTCQTEHTYYDETYTYTMVFERP